MDSTAPLDAPDPSPPPGLDSPRDSRPWDTRTIVWVGVAAALAVAAWLPFLEVPLSPDEGGFLLLAQHWSPGSSLYGPYWVDRPPLLIWLFSLAAHLGPVGHSAAGLTAPSVKLLGAGASGLAVLLAGVIALLVAPGQRWTQRATVVAAVALLTNPRLGMPETNGEVLALPFVLLGVACLITSMRLGWGRRAVAFTATAGASAVCAALVKQNVIDVFVFALVVLVASRGHLSHAGRRVAAFLGASGTVLAAALGAAALRGTRPAQLWDAIVVFRLDASGVIDASASGATSERMSHLALAALMSGAVVLLLVAAVGVVSGLRNRKSGSLLGGTGTPGGPRRAWSWGALGMALWELFGVAAGGSYWLHYLTGLVPGILLLLVLVPPTRRWRRSLALCLSYILVASIALWFHQLTTPLPVTVADDARVAAYLRGHAEPSDGVVVAFGHPDILAGSGLASPYEYLWSLPVRVRDPDLHKLSGIMTSSQAPRWVVVAGDSLDSWGLDATTAQALLQQHYVDRVTYGDWHIWQHRAGVAD